MLFLSTNAWSSVAYIVSSTIACTLVPSPEGYWAYLLHPLPLSTCWMCCYRCWRYLKYPLHFHLSIRTYYMCCFQRQSGWLRSPQGQHSADAPEREDNTFADTSRRKIRDLILLKREEPTGPGLNHRVSVVGDIPCSVQQHPLWPTYIDSCVPYSRYWEYKSFMSTVCCIIQRVFMLPPGLRVNRGACF